MKLGISTYTYNWSIGVRGYAQPKHPLTAEGLLRRAKAMQVDVVQICDGIAVHRLPDRELDSIAALAEELGLAIELGTSGVHPEHLRSYLRAAKRLNAKFLRTLFYGESSKPSLAEGIAWLIGVMSEFAANQVVIGIENHDSLTCAELLQIVRTVDSPYLGICLDTANSYGIGESTEYTVKHLAPYIVNLHIKDYQVQRLPHSLGFAVSGTAAGRGCVNIPQVLAMAERTGREFNVILELWTPFLGEVKKSIDLEEAWAQESMQYLRSVMA